MTLEAVPPGQQPTRMTPMANSSLKPKICDNRKAVNGMMMNCDRLPMMMSFGRVKTTLKSCGSRVRPIPNITRPRNGVIHAGEIQLNDTGNKSAIAATTMTITAIYFEMKLQILLSILCYPYLYSFIIFLCTIVVVVTHFLHSTLCL